MTRSMKRIKLFKEYLSVTTSSEIQVLLKTELRFKVLCCGSVSIFSPLLTKYQLCIKEACVSYYLFAYITVCRVVTTFEKVLLGFRRIATKT